MSVRTPKMIPAHSKPRDDEGSGSPFRRLRIGGAESALVLGRTLGVSGSSERLNTSDIVAVLAEAGSTDVASSFPDASSPSINEIFLMKSDKCPSAKQLWP